MINRILFLWILTFASSLVVADPKMKVSEFLELKSLSERIVKIFPPEKFFLLGVGRSPTPIRAYLDVLYPGYSSTLPLSNFRDYRPNARKIGIFPAKRLTQEEELRLFAHFDKHIPSVSDLAGRKLVTFDYSNMGESVLSTNEYIAKYLKTRGRSPHITSTVTTDWQRDEILNLLRAAGFEGGVIFELKDKSELGLALDEMKFKLDSEYSRFDFVSGQKYFTRRKSYNSFVRYMKSAITRYSNLARTCPDFLSQQKFKERVRRI